MEVSLYQKIALAKDIPEYGLRKGDVAMVVEELPPTEESHGEKGYALEVSNAIGETIDVVIVPESSIKPLTKKEVLHIRSWEKPN